MTWTAADWHDGHKTAVALGDLSSQNILWHHHPHRYHCDGYEVLAWPCPLAADVLDRLLVAVTEPPSLLTARRCTCPEPGLFIDAECPKHSGDVPA